MNSLGVEIPLEIKLVLEKKDFWETPGVSGRERITEGALPFKNKSNRTLFVRVAAHAAIGAAQKADSDLLCGLVSHPFSLVARAVAIKLIALFGDKGMQTIQSKISGMMHDGNAKKVALALRDAEIHQLVSHDCGDGCDARIDKGRSACNIFVSSWEVGGSNRSRPRLLRINNLV